MRRLHFFKCGRKYTIFFKKWKKITILKSVQWQINNGREIADVERFTLELKFLSDINPTHAESVIINLATSKARLLQHRQKLSGLRETQN